MAVKQHQETCNVALVNQNVALQRRRRQTLLAIAALISFLVFVIVYRPQRSTQSSVVVGNGTSSRDIQLFSKDTLIEFEENQLKKPVIVHVKTPHFFDGYERVVPNCMYMDRPIHCEYTRFPDPAKPDADALWYHVPQTYSRITRDKPHQLTVAMSMEGALFYSMLEDLEYMDQFDVEMTYRMCSHVQVPYFYENDLAIQNQLFVDPVPFEEKLDAIVYINSNCGALNGRNEIVAQLMQLNRLPVHAYGTCLRNQPIEGRGNKRTIFSKYKFCIAMENSNSHDYVTEKIWEAFESGCLPIYQGAPNILDFVPSTDSIVDYANMGTAEKLMSHLESLSSDKEAYMRAMAWRWTALDQLNPGFRKMVAAFGGGAPHSQCRLCQLIMSLRLEPRDLHRSHCMRNATWLKAREASGTSWSPEADGLLDKPHAHRWSLNAIWDPLQTATPGTPRSKSGSINTATAYQVAIPLYSTE